VAWVPSGIVPPDAAPIEPDDLLRRTFTSVRRGYDPVEVQKYLMSLASELRAGRERERALEGRLRSAEQLADELTEMAPSRLSSLVGEETARVLDAANAAATEIRTRGEESVARLLREAQDEATTLRRDADSILQRRTAEAEEAAAAIRRQADEVLQQARVEAEGEAEAGRQRGREMVVEAQRVRERMLRDLARRRKLLRQQIEQLQAGRGRLMAAYDVVRDTLDTATEELRVAVPEAKLAAEAAALRAAEDEVGEEPFEQELASLAAEADALAAEVDGGAPADAADADETAEAVEVDVEADDDVEAVAVVEAVDVVDVVDVVEGETAPDPPEGRHSSAVNVVRGPGSKPLPPPPAPEPDEDDSPVDTADEAAAADGGATADATVDQATADDATADDGADEGLDGDESSPSAKVAGLFARMKEESGLADDDDLAGDVIAAAEGVAGAGEPEGETGDDSALPADPDERARAERDATVEPLVRQIGRKVKRELSDEQNELLDAVRRQDTDLQVDDLLPAPEAHVERFSAAVQAGLVAAAAAGAASVGGEPSTPAGALRELGAEFAAELVAPLRDRIGRAFAEAGDDPDELAERLRACYREWRTQRVDDFADHTVVAAYNRGVLDAVDAGTSLRWLVDDGESPSPDCEDNALAGATPPGEAFPTGHLAPPTHPSCRCLLVVAVASAAPASA
jgi:DivIVA domain-containing protein